jgi:hypothetical protein
MMNFRKTLGDTLNYIKEFSSERCGSRGATVNLEMEATMKEINLLGLYYLLRPFFYQLVLAKLFVGRIIVSWVFLLFLFSFHFLSVFILTICLYIDYFFCKSSNSYLFTITRHIRIILIVQIYSPMAYFPLF